MFNNQLVPDVMHENTMLTRAKQKVVSIKTSDEIKKQRE